MPTSDRVTIPVGGVENIHWILSGLATTPAAGTVQASLDEGTTWNDVTINTDGTIQLLVAHPSVVPLPTGAVSATSGVHYMRIRLQSTPEVVIRSAGVLIVV